MQTIFPEAIHVALPPGWRDALNATARSEGQTAAEFVRRAIKAAMRGAAAEPAAVTDGDPK